MINYQVTVTDPLDGPDLQPLNPAIWSTDAIDASSAQIANNCCETDSANLFSRNYVTNPIGANPWASIDLLAMGQNQDTDYSEVNLEFARVIDGSVSDPRYNFFVFTSDDSASFTAGVTHYLPGQQLQLVLMTVPFSAITPGIEFKCAATTNSDGSITLKMWLGGVELFSFVDTVFKDIGPFVALYLGTSVVSHTQVTNFKAGNVTGTGIPDPVDSVNPFVAPFVIPGIFKWWWKKKKWA